MNEALAPWPGRRRAWRPARPLTAAIRSGPEWLGAVLALDDEDPRFGRGVGDVIIAGFDVADAPGSQSLHALLAVAAMVHVHRSLEDDEDLGAFVDVPDVGPVGPVQAHGEVAELRDFQGAPGALGGERVGVEQAHVWFQTGGWGSYWMARRT